MAKVSLSQAAKDTGVSLPTLSRWRKSGKISADKNNSGGYIIDTSEYDRIRSFKKESPKMKGTETHSMNGIGTHNDTPILEVEVKILRERIKDKDGIIEELREDRNEWKKQAQTLLLQHPKKQIELPENTEKEVQATPPHEKSPPPFKSKKLGQLSFILLLLVTISLLGDIVWKNDLIKKNQNYIEKQMPETEKNLSSSNTTPQMSLPNFSFHQQQK